MKIEFNSKVKLLLIPLFILLCYGVVRGVLPKDLASMLYERKSQEQIAKYEQQPETQPAREVARTDEKTKGVAIEKRQSCIIKGDIVETTEKKYSLPGCPKYEVIDINEEAGEKWFCSEEEAVQNGWTKAASCQ